MADTKLSSLTGLGTVATGDYLYILDVSDTTDSASGSSRKIAVSSLLAGQSLTNISDVTASYTELNVLDGIPATLTATELGYVDGVTSAIQTQIDTKQATITGAATTVDTEDLTASRALSSNASGKIAVATTTLAELNYVNGVTSAIQTQLNLLAPKASPSFTGDVTITSTANIIPNGTDPWRTISINAGTLKPTTTSGCASVTTIEAGTNDIDYDVLDFDTSSDENAYCNFTMPDSWDAGVVQFRYFWTNASGNTTETVVFEMSGRSYADSDAIDQAVGTAIEVSDTWLAQGDIHISAWSSDVTIAGTPAAGEWVHIEIMRDVSQDNLTGDVRLLAIQIRYKQAQYTD